MKKTSKKKARRKSGAKKQRPNKSVVKIRLAGGKSVTARAVPPSPKISQNGFTRPKPVRKDGAPKITFRVWEIADQISARKAVEAKKTKSKAKPATRQEVLTQCEKEKIKYSTFSNQFYRWRKFNGLFGRIRKDGKLAAVTGGPRKQVKPVAPSKKKLARKPQRQTGKKKGAVAPKPAVKTPPAPIVATKPAVPKQTALPFAVPAALPAAAAV